MALNPPNAFPAMTAQILFAKKRATETRAHSIVVSDTGFYWRELPGVAELTAALRTERFSLIIVDHADLAENPLVYVESLRIGQKDTPVLVVSEEFALENVVRAIRVGVKDLFHPPIDLAAIVERIYSVLKPELGPARSTRLDEWQELTVQFADRVTIPPLVGVERRVGPPRRAADLAQAGQLAELAAVREALAGARARQQELEQEVARLAANPPGMAVAVMDDTVERELAAERQKLETGRQLVMQLGRKFETEFAAWKASEMTARAEFAQREQALADQQRELAAAREKLDVELMLVNDTKAKMAAERVTASVTQAAEKEATAKLKQLVVGQSALTKAKEKLDLEQAAWRTARAQADAELATAVEKLAAEQVLANEQAADIAAGRKELAAGRDQWEQDKRELAAKEADLQEMQEQAHVLATQAAQTQVQLKAELAALAVEKETFERQAEALEERVRQFEARQQQVRAQMVQLFSAG